MQNEQFYTATIYPAYTYKGIEGGLYGSFRWAKREAEHEAMVAICGTELDECRWTLKDDSGAVVAEGVYTKPRITR